MRQLIVKHLRDQALLALLLGGLACKLCVSALWNGADWVYGQGAGLSAAWFFAGLLLGADSLERDRRGPLRQHLAHRGLGARRQFAARATASALSLFTFLMLELALLAALAFQSDDDALNRSLPTILVTASVTGTSLLWGLATGALTAAFVRTRWRLAIALVFVGAGAWVRAVSWQSAVGDVFAPNEWTWVGWNLLASTGVLWLASEAHRLDRDPTRPIAGPVRGIAGLAVLALASTTLGALMQTTCAAAIRSNALAQPTIALADGRLELVDDDNSSRVGRAVTLLAPSELLPRGPVFTLPTGLLLLHKTGFEFGPQRIALEVPGEPRFAVEHGGSLFLPELCFDLRAWQVRASFAEVDARFRDDSKLPRTSAPAHFDPHASIVLERPDGKPFSRQLERVEGGEGSSGFLLTDSGDLTLWTVAYSGLEARLTKLELPDGDAWKGWHATGASSHDLHWLLSSRGARLIGEKGPYQWTSLGFERVGDATPTGRGAGFVVRILDDDVLSPRVEIAHVSGAPRLEHRFAATPDSTALAVLTSTLDAPVYTLSSFLRPVRADRDPLEYTTLVSAGRRPWLLGLHVAIGLACAYWLARRQSFGLRRAWWALALLVGPAAAAFAALIEPRHRAPSEAPSQRRGLRIAGFNHSKRRRRSAS